MTQQFINHATGLPVWSVDENCDTIQTGSAVLGDGVVLATTPSPSNPTAGGLKMYSPDGETVSIVDARGFSSTVATGTTGTQLGPVAQDTAMAAWAFDPATIVGGGQAVSTGVIYLTAIYVRTPITVSNIWIVMANTQPVTANQCFVGLYNSAGALLAQADSSAVVNTLGVKTIAIASQQLTPGLYWVANMINFAATAPQVMAGNTTGNTRVIANGALAASQYRFCTNGTGTTTLPATITPASNSLTGLLILWAGLS